MENQTNTNNINNKITRGYNNRRKSDGSLYKSRLEMKEEYEKSILPYPFSAIWNLEYCWNICKSHFKNSIIFALPLSVVASYALNKKARTEGIKSKPFKYYLSLYVLVYTSLVGLFIGDSLTTCDYCKPWSDVYRKDGDNDNAKYRDILRSRIKNEQGSSDIKKRITSAKGLSDEEI